MEVEQREKGVAQSCLRVLVLALLQTEHCPPLAQAQLLMRPGGDAALQIQYLDK